MERDYLSSGEYPLLEEIIGDREPIEAFVGFDRGLQVILDGFAARYGLAERPARATRPRKPSRRRTR